MAGSFRRSIEYECLANQPTRALLRPGSASAKNILRSDMDLYLSYRVTAEKGAYNFLPRLMNKILDTAYHGLPERGHNLRRQHARTLCKRIVEQRPKRAELLLTTKSPETSKKLEFIIERLSEDPIDARVAEANHRVRC